MHNCTFLPGQRAECIGITQNSASGQKEKINNFVITSRLGKETSPSYISNFGPFFSELRQRNALPKVESPGAPLQRTFSEPTLAESPSQSNQSGDASKLNQSAIEPRKSNSLMNISSSSSGKAYAHILLLKLISGLNLKRELFWSIEHSFRLYCAQLF